MISNLTTYLCPLMQEFINGVHPLTCLLRENYVSYVASEPYFSLLSQKIVFIVVFLVYNGASGGYQKSFLKAAAVSAKDG